jgi:arylsulfatase A-like enzyme
MSDHESDRRDDLLERAVTRRDFLKVAGAAGIAAGALAYSPGISPLRNRALGQSAPRPGMNILFVMVDQMRTPWVYIPANLRRANLPNLTRLERQGVRFSNFYASSSMCTPSRATIVTGLYTHQNGIFATTPPTELNPGFPTYGTMLREQGYETYWFGKWHLSGGTAGNCGPNPYEQYGFTTDPVSGNCPSPNGGPGQGQEMDPVIRQRFVDWIAQRSATAPPDAPPWMATVSFVNPHDIAEYPRFTRAIAGESSAPSVYRALPANFESPGQHRARRKPLMQIRSMELENELFGLMPRDGSPARPWLRMLDLYLALQRQVDLQIGYVLTALRKSRFASNTVVVFTSDHGEYAGAHGMRGKGFAFYDEGVRVPLIVQDPSATWARGRGTNRSQMVEGVDLAALFMTIATGGTGWRGDPRYAHIAGRADIAAIARNPAARGRAYIAHATDEPGTSSQLPSPQQARPAPNHIVGVRTPRGKIARYAFWKDGGFEVDPRKRIDREVYDYSTPAGRREIDNLFGPGRTTRAQRRLIARMEALLQRAVETEIQAPLPAALQPVQQQAFADWFSQDPGEFLRSTIH